MKSQCELQSRHLKTRIQNVSLSANWKLQPMCKLESALCNQFANSKMQNETEILSNHKRCDNQIRFQHISEMKPIKHLRKPKQNRDHRIIARIPTCSCTGKRLFVSKLLGCSCNPHQWCCAVCGFSSRYPSWIQQHLKHKHVSPSRS